MTHDDAPHTPPEESPRAQGEGSAPAEVTALRTLLDQGIAAAQHGQAARARRALEAALASDPDNEEAWLWLAAMTEDHDLARAMYQRVRLAHPDSVRAQAGLRWLDQAAVEGDRPRLPLADPPGDGLLPSVLPVQPSTVESASVLPEPGPVRAAAMPPFGPDEGAALFVPPWERDAVVPVWGPDGQGPALASHATEFESPRDSPQALSADPTAASSPESPPSADIASATLAPPSEDLALPVAADAVLFLSQAQPDTPLSESLTKEPVAAMPSTLPPTEEEPSVVTPTPPPPVVPVRPVVVRSAPGRALRSVVMLVMLGFVLLGSLALAVVLASETQAERVRAALGVTSAPSVTAAMIAPRTAVTATLTSQRLSAGITPTEALTTTSPASVTTTLAIAATSELPLTSTISLTATLTVTRSLSVAGLAITTTSAITSPGGITSTGVFTAPWATARYQPLPLNEKWIEVDLGHQKLNAYEGTQVVFTTRISSGKSRTPTVLGKYRIERKFEATLMAGPGYYLPNVPWTMYFYGGYALHGAYWHHNWGTPMSHGCVNLSIEDSKWLYKWSDPVTRGAKAVVATAGNPGTWVIIHP